MISMGVIISCSGNLTERSMRPSSSQQLFALTSATFNVYTASKCATWEELSDESSQSSLRRAYSNLLSIIKDG